MINDWEKKGNGKGPEGYTYINKKNKKMIAIYFRPNNGFYYHKNKPIGKYEVFIYPYDAKKKGYYDRIIPNLPKKIKSEALKYIKAYMRNN